MMMSASRATSSTPSKSASRAMNDSIFSSSPVISTITESGPTSTISALKMFTSSMIWLRLLVFAPTFTIAISRLIMLSAETSRMLTTSMSLSTCLTTCSASVSASTTKVMRGSPGTENADRPRQLDEVRVLQGRGDDVVAVEELLPLAHHAQVVVVDDGELDRPAVLGYRGQFLHRHPEAPVAADGPDQFAGLRRLHAHGGRHLEAHRAQPAGGNERVRLVGPEELG